MALFLNTRNQKLFYIIAIGILFLGHLRNIRPEFTYALDSFVKLVQTESIKENHFQSEELLYIAKTFDPESKLQPLPTFTIRVKDQFLSPFSVDFAAFNALLLIVISKSHLPYVCLLFSILTLIVFQYSKTISFPTLILASLGTPLVYQGLEYSENSLLLLLQGIGFYFYFQDKNKTDKFLAGFFLSLGILLRLENIVFICILYFFLFLIHYKRKLNDFFRNESPRLLGVLLPILFFVAQNLFLYNHLFGARFISNQGSLSEFHLWERLIQAKNLIFLAYFKIGFFGFTPIFLFSIVYYLFRTNELKESKERVLLYSLLLFIPLIAFIAPNDGVTNWGARYLNLAILPSLYLFNSFYSEIDFKRKKYFRYLTYFLFGFSIIILLLGMKFQQVATKEIRLFQEDLLKHPSDLHVLGAETIGLYSGVQFYETPMILPKTAEELDLFLSNNRLRLGDQKKLIFSRIKSNASIQEGIKMGLFPSESHYETLLNVLRKHYETETVAEGKKLNFHLFSNP